MSAATFALIFGLIYAAIGVIGFIPQFLLPAPADAPPMSFDALYGYLFGLFPVNALHSLVHLAIGLWGIAAWAGKSSPTLYAKSLAVFYGTLAVLGLIPGLHTLFGMLPIHGHDVWLHAGTALVAAYVGFRSGALTYRGTNRRRTGDRRHSSLPVAQERRSGAYDRREGYGRTLAAG